MQRRAAPGTEAAGRQAEFKINPNKRIKEQKPNTNVNLLWRCTVPVPEGEENLGQEATRCTS